MEAGIMVTKHPEKPAMSWVLSAPRSHKIKLAQQQFIVR